MVDGEIYRVCGPELPLFDGFGGATSTSGVALDASNGRQIESPRGPVNALTVH